jgi:hypothetical protein
MLTAECWFLIVPNFPETGTCGDFLATITAARLHA